MIYADNYVKNIVNGVSGGNEKDVHTINVTPRRDIKVDVYADLKMASAGDKCARCGKEFSFTRGIETGHIFKLGTKYSAAMHANFLGEDQKEKTDDYGLLRHRHQPRSGRRHRTKPRR